MSWYKNKLHILIPFILGVVALIIGIYFIPKPEMKQEYDPPNRVLIQMMPDFGSHNYNFIEGKHKLLQEAYDGCVLRSGTGDNNTIHFTRLSKDEYSVLIDPFGIIYDSQFSYFTENSFPDTVLNSKEFKGNYNKGTLPHHVLGDNCKYLVVNLLNYDLDVFDFPKVTAELKATIQPQGRNVISLKHSPLNFIKSSDSLSESISIKIPLWKDIVGIRFSFRCRACLVGGDYSSTINLSAFLLSDIFSQNPMSQPYIYAYPFSRYMVEPMKGYKSISRNNIDITNIRNGGYMAHLFVVWRDLEAGSSKNILTILSGILMGLGLTLIVGAFITLLKYFENKNNTT